MRSFNKCEAFLSPAIIKMAFCVQNVSPQYNQVHITWWKMMLQNDSLSAWLKSFQPISDSSVVAVISAENLKTTEWIPFFSPLLRVFHEYFMVQLWIIQEYFCICTFVKFTPKQEGLRELRTWQSAATQLSACGSLGLADVEAQWHWIFQWYNLSIFASLNIPHLY